MAFLHLLPSLSEELVLLSGISLITMNHDIAHAVEHDDDMQANDGTHTRYGLGPFVTRYCGALQPKEFPNWQAILKSIRAG
jgi:hypothetical protein